MKRFVTGVDRTQVSLLPECVDDFVTEDNPVRVIDAFIDELDLGKLGFEGVEPEQTGRPAYHPATLLKIYVYGYLNRVQSTRRLECETQRNVELMWLTGRLTPDFKTIANFRKDNGKAIRRVCRQFIVVCRQLGLFSQDAVAIDGSKFKAVNNRDKNFTPAKLKRRREEIDASIDRYLSQLDTADRQEPEIALTKIARLKDKVAALRARMQDLNHIEAQLLAAPDQQYSLTDPDARSMKDRDGGIVGYNVQTAVDTQHHLIVAHEVINIGSDRNQLSSMAQAARAAMGTQDLTAFADRGYFTGEEIVACEQSGISAIVPKPMTSNAHAEGRFDKRDFVYVPADDEYRCPAGERAIWRFTSVERGVTVHKYWSSACPRCPIKAQCTPSDYRRIARSEHQDVLDAMQARLDRHPDAMRVRRETVEHPFGTLKAWMGAAHFLMKTLPKVKTEMSLHVLAYNLKRVMKIVGIKPLIAAIRSMEISFYCQFSSSAATA